MSASPDTTPGLFVIEFYEDAAGSQPVLDWIKNELTPTKRRALGTAMRRVLQVHGTQVCRNHWGKKVHEDGIYEFRLRMTGRQVVNLEAEIHGISEEEARARIGIDASADILLRVFFHPHGDKLLLLLGGYDKGRDPSARRQQAEIKIVHKRLTAWRRAAQLEQKGATKGRVRRP
jgi:hypothetical protein